MSAVRRDRAAGRPAPPRAGGRAPQRGGGRVPQRAGGRAPQRGGGRRGAARPKLPRMLRLGLPRDPNASRNVTGFLVTAVVTVLVTRAILAASGYPQVSTGNLHIAHVLWGGLAMALAVVLLLTFIGPVVRPLAAVLGGIGFGLFVDEVGKFVTADHDYFYEPTAALVYGIVVAMVLIAELLHGRRAPHPAELLAAATDRAVAGVAGGFAPGARAEAERLARRGADAPTAPEVRALIDAVPESSGWLLDLVAAVSSRVDRALRRAASRPRVDWGLAWVLLIASGASMLAGIGSLIALLAGWDVPWWISAGAVLSGGICLLVALRGLRRIDTDPRGAAVSLRRSALVNLLITQILVFRILEWAAVGMALANLIAFAVLDIRLNRPAPAARYAGKLGPGVPLGPAEDDDDPPADTGVYRSEDGNVRRVTWTGAGTGAPGVGPAAPAAGEPGAPAGEPSPSRPY